MDQSPQPYTIQTQLINVMLDNVEQEFAKCQEFR